MPGLTLYSGNRLEFLAGHLAASLQDTPSPPLTPEIIVVQNPDMGRWLSAVLARTQGICANVRFPLPNIFIREILSLLTAHDIAPSCFHKEILLWNIMARLPELSLRDIGKPIRPYLATGNSRKIYQLARSITSMFDRYGVFRPEILLAWEQGKTATKSSDEPWQAALWQEIITHSSTTPPADSHHASLLKGARDYLLSGKSLPPTIPSRLTLFAMSSLPPTHLDILAGLSRHCDIALYILNPCQEYWEDIVSDLDISRLRRTATTEDLYLARGNPFLASLGRLTRDFLTGCRSYDIEEEELFIRPDDSHLLALIQSDILDLVDRTGPHDSGCQPLSINPGDSSVQIHACHSRLREVEVLHDHILHLLNDIPGLFPRDIRVCAPDLKVYVPLVRAVFETGNRQTSVPYTIVDSKAKAGSLTETFLAILDLADSRMTAAQIMKIIESPAVCRCFGLSGGDLLRVHQMIENTGIRWGIDCEDRHLHGLPPFAENSWQAGFDRLLLGYAMNCGKTELYRGILPADTILGESTELLGTFLECITVLFECVRAYRTPCSAEEWSEHLHTTLDRCLTSDDGEEEEYLHIRRCIRELSQHTQQAVYTAHLESGVVRDHLRLTLEYNPPGPSSGILSGGVHFCDLRETRAIPARIICLVGMNDPEFPRPDPEVSFDLMNSYPRPGDRSIRLDDRSLFLETLVSARDQLYISYIGRSAIDDTALSPSVLVSDLIDIIDQGYLDNPPHPNAGQGKLCTNHHLQPFHPSYFQVTSSEIKTSFSRENCRAAQTLTSSTMPPQHFFSSPLTPPSDMAREMESNTLCTFFLNPTRFLCIERLHIRISNQPDLLAEDEPFALTGLDRYTLENEILHHHRAGGDSETLFLAAKAAGDLPVGQSGKALFQRTWNDIEKLEKSLTAIAPGPGLPPIPFHLVLPPFTIYGVIDNAHTRGLVQLRCASIKAKDRIRAWILHLLYGVVNKKQGQEGGMTLLLGKDKTSIMRPAEDPEAELTKLLSLYWQGLSSPLPLFAETSFTFALNRFQKKSEEESLGRARDVWTGTSFRAGECEDPYYRISSRNHDPLDQDFIDIAETFFFPLLEHQE